MAYRKLKGSKMFDGQKMLEQSPVLIIGDDGTIRDIVETHEAGDDIEIYNGIISPGFINCHCHLELSHMKGKIPERTGLVKFVYQVVTARHGSEQEILEAISIAEDEMLNNGIVAVGDICNNAMTIPQKLKGRLWYHNFIEASGFNPSIAEERFQRSVAFFTAYSKLYSLPVESNSITPHAAYSVSDKLWEKIIHFPGNHLFTIHNQETEPEDEWFRTATGEMAELFSMMKMDTSFFQPSKKSSIQTYLSKFLHNQSVILVHNVHTSDEDINFAKQTGLQLHWCLCPNANLYISGNLPKPELFIKHDVSIVLGTDSLASNNQLSIVEEMKTLKKHYPALDIATMLKWATYNGAKALAIDQLMGSFAKNKKPGVVLLSEDLETIKKLA